MPQIESWIEVPARSDFPIYNLPYGTFRRNDAPPRIGVAIGTKILDLYALADAGLLDGACEREVLMAPTLNAFLAKGRATWRNVRFRIAALLRTDEVGDDALRARDSAHFFIEQRDARMVMPAEIGDYVDFYSSLEHATNLGKIFRPNGEALMPNWRHIPIGYHGRSSTVVIDGTPVIRPSGQRKPQGSAAPVFGATTRLDIELEVGFITGPGNALGRPIPIEAARDHIFGLVLVNDWSARDIQAWEYQPLGPFLGKSFATTISPWIVTLDALDPFRVAGPRQDPTPLPYLQTREHWAYDIKLAVDLETRAMRAARAPAVTISQTTFKDMYWNMAQQLAHVTVNGTAIRPGDLYASGTISGAAANSQGSLIELTWNGTKPLTLPDGEKRAFLEDGDEVALRGWCEAGDFRIGFGQARGRIEG
ncbi:MAG TPA: fumarylacetoacetase [Candidatus Baltobacteraceae bacterium]|nr:fumarylacetoacetase [Candidatus Baltobacteraceae bacterium]